MGLNWLEDDYSNDHIHNEKAKRIKEKNLAEVLLEVSSHWSNMMAKNMLLTWQFCIFLFTMFVEMMLIWGVGVGTYIESCVDYF